MRTAPWDWADPTIRLAPPRNPGMVIETVYHPSPEAIAFFLRVVCPEEPARDGLLYGVWSWLKGLAT